MNPAELAQPFAEHLMMRGALDSFDPSADEKRAVAELERLADSMGLLDQPYLVDSSRSVIIPSSVKSEVARVFQFNELRFEGELRTFSTVRFQASLGIRALCLTFDNVRILPGAEAVGDDGFMHVPAFAVQSIDRLAA